MSSEPGADSTAANLNLSPEEKRVYGDLFKQADPENLRVVTGDAALGFFDKTRLDSRVLGEIWQIADRENRGFLTPAGFGIVLRLIGHAQAGREPRPELAFQQGPLPRFDGVQLAASPSSPPGPAAAVQAQGTGGAVRMPPLTPEKVAQYSALFERQPRQGNMLSGDQARQIFDKSSLPNETLGRIWALADTEQRGALVLAEFVIAMHLLTSIKSGALRALPGVLPAGLYEAATQRVPARLSPNNTGMSAIPRQLSGSAQPRTGSPLGRPPLAPQTSGSAAGDWVITPAEKERFDQLYATLDKGNKGYITGDEAVPFFSQSNLSEDALAQIWDLADFNSQGQLTTEGFAVAMYLIRQQRSGRSVALPTTLPANLVPPSARGQQRPAPAASAFDPPPMTQPPPPQPKSALDDLFGLDSGPASAAPAPTQTTMSTGGSNAHDPFGAVPPLPPTSPVRVAAPSSSTFKPFVPSSTFGRGLTTRPSVDAMGTSPSKQEDLLEDNDPEATKKMTGETTELANLSNQVGSLSKQMQDVQTKRTATQNELNQTNSQKQNFEQRLAQLRTLYEKEAESTRELEDQLRKSREETQKLQAECMTVEGTLRDQQTQHQQTSAALQADKQENANLRERIRVVNGEIAQLKPQIEKLKAEARQQKGLVAINKKQQATTEGDRDKLKSEAEALAKGGDEVRAESSSPVSAQVASPALSTASGNNPFFKRTGSADIMGGFSAAPPRAVPDSKSFDDVFGPSFGAGSSPPTTFKQQHTGNSVASGGSFGSNPHAGRSVPPSADMAPPPPPESKQINSSFLPFPDHSESLSSSRQVSPPASRVEAPVGAGLAISSGEEGAEQSPTPSATPVPGAEPAARSSDQGEAGHGSFGNGDHAKAKADFDDAFASFAASGKTQASDGSKSQPGFASEFPPISELEHDDESDSNSERGGFDDDFSPAPQPTKAGERGHQEPAAAAKEKEVPRRGSEQVSSPATVTTSKPADNLYGSAAAKGTLDDLDDDFEGLEDAKEGSADDDFANISHNDFNPVFDSSPPASQTKSESTAFGNESSFDFVASNPTAANNNNNNHNNNQQKMTDNPDWDSIFSGLDSPSAVSGPGLAHPANKDKDEARPPQLGRALTDKGEHDDPMVKGLTGMGYSRADAVLALEKYDYNLERAANFLASQS
ncbi:hypothetical protein XA68_13534 [Ophiocordyceps unilateralis]|uniref:UBA domain-containing protein n=1 Tax=Ophiocordyceps unilateralis TaxID=268505 RepID=A0A2A9PCJ6_OPHUN|nr:hypothetical protein XA68_13534 [Ophiocordyceps unilateralis]